MPQSGEPRLYVDQRNHVTKQLSKTAQKIINNLLSVNIFAEEVSSLRQDEWNLRVTNLC